MFTICGHTLKPAEKKHVILQPADGYEMPAILICGTAPGKTVLITAGMHGGEYPGIPAIIQTAEEIDPEQVTGNLMMIPCVNTSGFRERTDKIVPEDGGNLNACFPGAADGTVSQQIANYFVTQIFPHVDFFADMHSGSQQEPLTPCLFFPKWKKVREKSLDAAKSMNMAYLIQSTNKNGASGYAASSMGIPSVIMERGHSGFCKRVWIAAYRRDLRMLLKHLGCYDYEKETAVIKRVFTRAVYVEAMEDGVWYPRIKPGKVVAKGDTLGYVQDFFGNLVHEYRAKADGVVFYYCGGLSVTAGRNLVTYGIEEE